MFSIVSVCHSVQVATEARTAGKRAVCILLEWFLVIMRHQFIKKEYFGTVLKFLQFLKAFFFQESVGKIMPLPRPTHKDSSNSGLLIIQLNSDFYKCRLPLPPSER